MIVYLFIAENEVPQEPVDFGYLTKMDTHKKEVAEESVVAVMKLNANPCVDLSEDKIYSENKNCCLRDWCDDNHKKQDASSNFPPKVPTIVQLMDKEKSNNRSFKKECRHIDCTFGKQEEGLSVSGSLGDEIGLDCDETEYRDDMAEGGYRLPSPDYDSLLYVHDWNHDVIFRLYPYMVSHFPSNIRDKYVKENDSGIILEDE